MYYLLVQITTLVLIHTYQQANSVIATTNINWHANQISCVCTDFFQTQKFQCYGIAIHDFMEYSKIPYTYVAQGHRGRCDKWGQSRDKSILHLFSPILLSGNSFSYLLCSRFCLKFQYLSYIASYLTVTSYTLYTSTAYAHHGQL